MISARLCIGVLLVSLSSLGRVYGKNQSAERQPLEVQVEITEVNNSKATSLGVEWLDSLGISEKFPADVVSVGGVVRATNLRADVHFLVEQGAAELLANPNLITDSGTIATFHAGGQIPYVTTSNLGTSQVEFKPYGVMLNIRPELLDNGLIQLKIQASVSAPDLTNGIVLSGAAVPALLEREVTSNVTLEPESTMTLAGLVQTQKEEKAQGIPILRKIPFIGALFRWKKTSFRRTTIIMFVTPKMVDS